MATRTTNLSLIKPGPDDAVNVADLNENFDKIDQFAGEAGSAAYTKEETDALLAGKVDTEAGKGLSENDFTDAYKEQITKNKDGIAAVANQGGKNLLKMTATSDTINGVVFTVNSDGSVTVNADGTQTSSAFFYLVPRGDTTTFNKLSGKDLIISGCPSGGTESGSGYRLRCWHYKDSLIATDTGSGAEFKLENSDYDFTIVVGANTVCNNVVFKPMVRLKEIEDSTYQPYAPTNRELYEMILALQAQI